MAAEPLNRIVLGASSVAEDLGYVALADIARVMRDTSEFRVIGGHMVTVLASRWRLGAALHRETRDADLGVPPIVARDLQLVGRFRDIGYERIAGDRFAKTVSGSAARAGGRRQQERTALIDVLVPAYTTRPRQNRRVGPELVVTEVGGLAAALNRSPVVMELELRRLDGETLDATLPFPDEVSALAMKGHATRSRDRATDVVDVWRCLEVAYAAGAEPRDFSSDALVSGADAVRSLFARRDGHGMRSLVSEQRLTSEAAGDAFTRIRALVQRVLGE